MAPPEFFNLYDPGKLPLPGLREPADFPDHPVLRKLREVQNYEDHFRDEEHVRIAIAAYYGMVSFLDDNIGRVLKALRETGIAGDVDHLHQRSWRQSRRADFLGQVQHVRGGRRCAAHFERTRNSRGPPRSHSSLARRCVSDDHRGGRRAPTSDERELPGTSLLHLIENDDADRSVFSEYHAVGSLTGIFMVRFGRYKYVHYEGYHPQLFDLEDDPMETRDLALEPGHEAITAEGEKRLRAICDPTEVSERAFHDQERRIAELGGVEAVLTRGSYPYTPAPGEAPRFS